MPEHCYCQTMLPSDADNDLAQTNGTLRNKRSLRQCPALFGLCVEVKARRSLRRAPALPRRSLRWAPSGIVFKLLPVPCSRFCSRLGREVRSNLRKAGHIMAACLCSCGHEPRRLLRMPLQILQFGGGTWTRFAPRRRKRAGPACGAQEQYAWNSALRASQDRAGTSRAASRSARNDCSHHVSQRLPPWVATAGGSRC